MLRNSSAAPAICVDPFNIYRISSREKEPKHKTNHFISRTLCLSIELIKRRIVSFSAWRRLDLLISSWGESVARRRILTLPKNDVKSIKCGTKATLVLLLDTIAIAAKYSIDWNKSQIAFAPDFFLPLAFLSPSHRERLFWLRMEKRRRWIDSNENERNWRSLSRSVELDESRKLEARRWKAWNDFVAELDSSRADASFNYSSNYTSNNQPNENDFKLFWDARRSIRMSVIFIGCGCSQERRKLSNLREISVAINVYVSSDAAIR